MFMVVGVVGQAGAGKDTVASIVTNKYNFKRVALADKLKSELSIYFSGFHDFALDRQNARDRSPIVRRAQQILGTEIRRAQDDRYWLKELAMTIVGVSTSGLIGAIVSDVRFENEVETIQKEWGGKIIFIERDHKEHGVNHAHASEANIYKLKSVADYIIDNNHDINALTLSVINIMDKIIHDNSST